MSCAFSSVVADAPQLEHNDKLSCARYLLTHRNWKFQKYMSQKVHSDDMPTIEATSADNVLMAVGTLDACQIPWVGAGQKAICVSIKSAIYIYIHGMLYT